MSNRRIVLVRHGESEEDIDPSIKSAVDDPAKLTAQGRLQAQAKAEELTPLLLGFSGHVLYHSPSVRVKETSQFFLSKLPPISPDRIFEDGRIRNLDWGSTNSDNVREVEAERYKVGVLNFHFPDGDHTPTYVGRIGSFCEEVVSKIIAEESVCALIFTHGFALRVIAKHFIGISNEDFRYLSNPGNCFTLIIDVEEGSGGLIMTPLSELPRVKFDID